MNILTATNITVVMNTLAVRNITPVPSLTITTKMETNGKTVATNITAAMGETVVTGMETTLTGNHLNCSKVWLVAARVGHQL